MLKARLLASLNLLARDAVTLGLDKIDTANKENIQPNIYGDIDQLH